MLVELPTISRDIRNLEDAQTFIDMVLDGQWMAISDGLTPAPFDY